MKIIDLLNKIANGEEVHFKTKLNGKEVGVNYYNDRDFSTSTGLGLLTIADIIKSLNDEVEIIKEEKKIPEKLKIEQDTPSSNYYIRNENGTKCALTKHSKMITETLNQVIDYLDYLKSKGE